MLVKSERFKQDLLEWSETNLRKFPWRQDDARVYEIFIAEFLLVQTPADRVASVLPDFVSMFPDFKRIDSALEEDIAAVLEPLGLQNRRARALKEIAEAVEGDLPRDPETMRHLPRVGPYISNATATFALAEFHPLLDTNIRRIISRLWGDEWPDDEDEQMEMVSDLLGDASDPALLYFALLDFGALICKAPTPHCELCFAKSYCSYYQNEVKDR